MASHLLLCVAVLSEGAAHAAAASAAPVETTTTDQPPAPLVQESLSDGSHPQTAPTQPSPASSAQPSPVSQPLPATRENIQVAAAPGYHWLSYFGLALDLGVSGVLPEGGLLLTGRPARWAHIKLGMGFNGIGFAIRGGMTLVNPFVVPVSLTWEGGHYFEGDANRVVHWFSSDRPEIAALKRFSYDYMSLLAGLEVGNRQFTFFVRAGLTWMNATVKDFQKSVNDLAHIDVVASNPQIHCQGPALKLGTVVFFQ
jgi:hypothetical protein